MSKHLTHYNDVRTLRTKGLTYSEINKKLGTNIPKNSLTHICRGIVLTDEQITRISQLVKDNLVLNRQKAVIANKRIFDSKLIQYRQQNQNLKRFMSDRRAKLIALAMLYLGEGGKWKSHRGLFLGSADPMIIQVYLNLLDSCFGITRDKLHGRIQYRADQDYGKLLSYWSKVSGIKKQNFYPGYIDKRTIGKITIKTDYRGVCVVTCGGTAAQLELEQIIGIIDEAITGGRSSVD